MDIKSIALAASALILSSSVNAVTITYQGDITSGDTVTGNLIGDRGIDAANTDARDWWTFSGNAGDVIDITGGRLDADLDLAFTLYFGTTSVDESLFTYDSSFGGMTIINFFDDNWGPNIPGVYADPQVLGFVLPSTGTYSIAVMSAINDPLCGDCSYALALNSSLSTVPVPAAVWLFGSGLLGLVGVARRKKA